MSNDEQKTPMNIIQAIEGEDLKVRAVQLSTDPFLHRELNRVKAVIPHEPEVYGLIAVGADGAFGLGEGLPWKNSTDMKWFAKITDGKAVVVSRKTFNTIPNKLPGRIHYFASRDGVKSGQGWPIDFNRLREDVFVIGGKRVIENNISYLDGFYVTIIPGEHKHDVSFDIDFIYKNGFRLDYIGGSKSNKDYCYLLAFSKRGDLVRHEHPIHDFFEPYLKLTVKEDLEIKPGAHGQVKVNEKVFTPKNQIGIFGVRKRLGDAGLYSTAFTFKREWVGTPTIAVTNKSLDTMYLRKGDEIGEIAFVNNLSI